MKKLKECPICLSKRILSLFDQKDKNIGAPGKFSLFKCNNCEGIFLNPQPSYEESSGFYPKGAYYSLNKIKTERKSVKTKVKLELYKTYFSESGNKLKRFLFSPFRFMIRSVFIKNGAKLLDIGCGSGQFLYEMKSLGLNVYGIEQGKFDEEGNKKYSLHIINGEIEKAKYNKEQFDIITLNHVLEHTNNPNKTLIVIKKALKKEGILIIGVPNTNSWAYKIFKKNWYQLDVPRHIIDYSNKNLKLLLEKNGFKILKTRYNSRPSQFSVSFMYSLNIKNSVIKHALDTVFLPLTWIANSLRVGDQIEVLCKKK